MRERYKKVAIEAALASGLLIKRSVGKISKVSYKGRDNIVTDVDKASERLIIKKLRGAFSDHAILSEESAPLTGDSGYKWIIDPLDGTTNFAHAFPFFCVSIGLEHNGSIVMGVIYDPIRDELFVSESGKGAYLNKRRIRVSKIDKLSASFLATGFSYGNKKKDKNIDNFKKLLTRSFAIRRAGSAALDLCYVACGRFDGYWEMFLKPWDSAAGVLMVKEAGGKLARFNGGTYSHYDEQLLATNGLIDRQMIKFLSS